MTKRLLIDALHPEEMRVCIADERQIHDFDFFTAGRKQIKGNIYLAKITRVEPSLQAAFVEYGGGKQGFLPFAEIHSDYYQIPVSDRKRLQEEAENDEPVETPNEALSQSSGIDATLGEAPAFESGPGYDAPADGSADENNAFYSEASLPTLEAIPDPAYSEAELNDDTELSAPAKAEAAHAPSPEPLRAAPAAATPSLAFATSELVAQETYENEELAARLSEDEAGESETTPRAESEDNIDTIPSEDEESSPRPKRNNFHRRYKIQEVIKRGQIVLVQVIKEERGNKGVSLTTYLSLAGRYCVLMPNSPKDGGISRKISDGDTRKRLKEMLSELKLARGMSVIIRTAGVDRTRAEIRRDFDYLVKLWNRIRETTLSSTAPAIIYEESDLIKRAIRDLYTNDIQEVLVEGEAAYKSARDFMKMLLPSHTPRVKHYKDNMPLFYAYGIEDQLLSMHDPVVKLKSGGYLVLNPTEALISIDVNSGRSTAERNIEETATKTNLEAAAEIARQLRLRDLAGLVVIDFIDMMESRNRRNVERALKDALKSDRAKIQLGRISPFGLLEMSRQRLRSSIAEANTVACPHCVGRGRVRSNDSMSIQIIRSLEKEAASGNWQLLKLAVPEHTALHLLNNRRTLLTQIEERTGVSISVSIDHDLSGSNFTIEKVRRQGRGDDEAPRERSERPERERTRGGRGRNRDRSREAAVTADELIPSDEAVEAMVEEDAEATNETASGEEGAPRERRRGRRGGRGRNRDRNRDRNRPASEGEEGDSGNEIAAAPNDADGNMAEANEENSDAPRERQNRNRNDRAERGERGDGRRGNRGGRGRRRWREDGTEGAARDGNGNAESANEAVPMQASGGSYGAERPSHDGQAETRSDSTPRPYSPSYAASSGNSESLPAFTRSPAVEPRMPAPQQAPVHHAQPTESTHRPDGQPPRKGWWQRIIELD